MKTSMRLSIALMFFVSIATLNSLAYSVVCSDGPTTTKTGNGSNQVLYSCTIPANTIATDRSVRITAEIVGTGSPGDVGATLLINGVAVWQSASNHSGFCWHVNIMNTGSTTGFLAGFVPFYNTSEPYISVEEYGFSITGLSWASAQTVELEFDSSSAYKATGDMFIVEAID